MRLLTTTDWSVRRGMLLAGGVAAVSAFVSLHLSPQVLFAAAIVLVLTCLVPFLRRPIWVYIVVWAAVFLSLFGLRRLWTVDPVRRLAGREDVITAEVIELPSSGRMVTVEILEADKLPHGSRVLLYGNELVAPKLHETVSAEVELKALYSTQQSYQADGVFLQAYPTAYDEEAMVVTAVSHSWRNGLSPLRERLLGNIRARLSGEEGALLAGICLGEKGGMSEATMTAFRRAGLPHVLAVSGLHLSIISAGVYGLLRFLLSHRRLAAALTMAAVGFFMALIGFTPSVVRAGVMCLVMLSGQLFTRRADGLNSMGLALVLLLAVNPYCLLDAGLQLSFGAAGGVLCLTKPLQERLYRLRLWKPVADGVAVTLAASLPILPLLGYYFGEVSVVSPLANLLAVVPASVVLVFGWIGTLLTLFPPLAFVANGVLYLAGQLVRWLLIVAHTVGGLPFATVSTERAWTILYLTGGGGLVILCLCKLKGQLRRLLAYLAAALVLAVGVDTRLHRDTTVITASMRADSAVLLLDQDGRHGLIVQDVAGIYVSDALVRACDGELDFVIVGDGETPDAACLTELMRRVEVKRLLVGEGASFTVRLDLPAEPLKDDTELELWTDTTLAVDVDGEWRLSCRGTTLAIAPEGACVADGAIFVGEPPRESKEMTVGQGVLLADEDDEAAFTAAAALPYPMAAVTEESLYLTTRSGGEWSVKRWR